MNAGNPDAAAHNAGDEHSYADFLHGLQARFEARLKEGGDQVFDTTATGLFDDYLAALPAELRQRHTCSCCQNFVRRFGGLVTLAADGRQTPLLWGDDAPGIHRAGVAAMAAAVRRATVRGVFLATPAVWGRPQAGGHPHMHVTVPQALQFKRTLLTAGQKMAERREDFSTMERALGDFHSDHVATALQLLRSDQLYSAERVLGQAEFLHQLHTDRAQARSPQAADNILWRAIASAPAGFCHPRSSMIGTLLEDIAAGKSYADVSRAFAAKMHPLRYLRPQAAPTAGGIAQAEKVFEQLGLAPALPRRMARFEEVPKTWTPRRREPAPRTGNGLFAHVLPKGAAQPKSGMATPAITMTLQKFVRTIIPTAEQIEVQIRATANPFIGITTAVNEDAPRLFQWDHPFSWYVWSGGSPAAQFGLSEGWVSVAGITRLPARWDDDGERFKHQGDGIILLLDGARETRNVGAALFPSLLRAELHGVRATVEAHSNAVTMAGLAEGSAVGIDLRDQGNAYPASLRVVSNGWTQAYTIDRWD